MIMMKKTFLAIAAVTGVMAAAQVHATTVDVQMNGPGVSGALVLTYGATTDANYPNGYEVTGISGTFSDVNNGLNIVNVPVGPLVAVTHSVPESTNLLAPNDFSRFPVASGLPAQNNGFLTYDNLFWPGGSPQTASDYPPHGGFLDIYGLMFNIGGGRVVDFWSNGIFGGTTADYGVAVARPDLALDYVGGGVTGVATASIPEPAAWAMMLVGFAGIGFAGPRRRRSRHLDFAA
jgi:hypothetical protein